MGVTDLTLTLLYGTTVFVSKGNLFDGSNGFQPRTAGRPATTPTNLGVVSEKVRETMATTRPATARCLRQIGTGTTSAAAAEVRLFIVKKIVQHMGSNVHIEKVYMHT